MSTRTRRILMAGAFALAAFIMASAVAQAIRLHSMGPVWMVGWLPAVLVATTYPALSGRGPVHRCSLPRPRRPAAPE